jgi:predicted  nucleic acid-binding Zn-ribbon protein
MAGIFKKAMGLFVEFEEDTKSEASEKSDKTAHAPARVSPLQTLNAEDLDKFEKHFEKLFEQANQPGPDYYEFMKMCETLEAHIKDERARLSATYASLTIQGLTKEKLLDSANKYREIINHDKTHFEKIANEKSEKEIGHKKKELVSLEETIKHHSEMIQKLTKEITESQAAIGRLKTTIQEEEGKLHRNKQGYLLACEAMTRKISDDITKIQTTL